MKRRSILLSAFFSMGLLVLLCACGNQKPTPSPVVTPTPSPTPVPISYTLEISELMPSNKSSICDNLGNFPDWVEIVNYGSESLSLEDCCFTSGSSHYKLSGFIAPGEYRCFLFTTQDFKLSKDGGELELLSPEGSAIQHISYPEVSSDVSIIVDSTGALCTTDYPSPGFENTPEGYESFQCSLTIVSPLVISEVLPFNNTHLKQGNDYYDIVEVQNVSSLPIELSDWYLSDKGSERTKYRFPEAVLDPGNIFTVFCTGLENSETTNVSYASFALNSQDDTLFLSKNDGTLCDFVHLKNIPYNGSLGRKNGENGFFYYSVPTPGQPNEGECARLVAERPLLRGHDGVFNGVTSIAVELDSPGEIHYTLDGTAPSAFSPLYTEPIILSSTAVIRAITVQPGFLNSETLDLSYIINESHTLPVFSVVMDPASFSSIYNNPDGRGEAPASAAFFEDGNSFTIKCGLKLHGATSRYAQKKKSMKLCFRGRYEGPLEYDLFGNRVTDFSSILLRAAQEDAYSTLIRDRMLHQLAHEAFPELSVQDAKFAVLYINGDYRGIYNLREAHSTSHFAAHTGQSKKDLIQWQEAWPYNSVIGDIYRMAMQSDLKDEQIFNSIAAHLDLNSIIGWTIIQAYSGNFDIAPPNTRFYFNTQSQVMSYALVDLDLSMFEEYYWSKALDSGYPLSSLSRTLLRNPGYRQEFLQQLGNALAGPLSNENVHAAIDAAAAEIRPEIPRDRARWGGTVERWEFMLNSMHRFVDLSGGRARALANMLNVYSYVAPEEKELYFSSIK